MREAVMEILPCMGGSGRSSSHWGGGRLARDCHNWRRLPRFGRKVSTGKIDISVCASWANIFAGVCRG